MVDTRSDWLLPLLALFAAWNAAVVWLAQVSGYPLWLRVGSSEFGTYYAAWSSGSFWLISVPIFLTLAGVFAALLLHVGGVPNWQLWGWLVLQAAMAGLTILLWTPSAAHLSSSAGGLNQAAFAGFEETHWIRVAMATAVAAWIWHRLGRVWIQAPPGSAPARSWLLLITAAFACFSVAQVWMVQTLCYRVWPLVGKRAFYGYHVAWWHSIWTVIFIPAGLTLIGAVALVRWRPMATSLGLIWTAVALQALLALLTGLWWGPLMGRLASREDGLLMNRYNLLMSTHWLRVGIVTAYGVAMLWALAQNAVGSMSSLSGRG